MRRRCPPASLSHSRGHTPVPGTDSRAGDRQPCRGQTAVPGRCGDPAAAPCRDRHPVSLSRSYLPFAPRRRARHGGLLPREPLCQGRCARAGRGAQPVAPQRAGCPGSPGRLGCRRSPRAALPSRAAGPQRRSPRTKFGGGGGPRTPGGRHGRAGPPTGLGSGGARRRLRPPGSGRGEGCGQRPGCAGRPSAGLCRLPPARAVVHVLKTESDAFQDQYLADDICAVLNELSLGQTELSLKD
ncbi:cuticle collagen 2C-like [Sylvia atricapilla]|uniref:cuticle collagen 2C-like n=1 Tax=Sylvia atricapilla TaxID=48155 RepID=UPI00339AAD82